MTSRERGTKSAPSRARDQQQKDASAKARRKRSEGGIDPNSTTTTTTNIRVEESDDDASMFTIGDRVLVGSSQETGTVKFIGITKFSLGTWIGIALDKALGKNDGTVKGVSYFKCEKEHGLFVRKGALTLMNPAGNAKKLVDPKSSVKKKKQPARTGSAQGNSVDSGESDLPKAVEDQKPASLQPQDPAAVAALSELKMAIEDHDTARLQVVLDKAIDLGVATEDVAVGQRLLRYENHRAFSTEIQRCRSVVADLTQSVQQTQEKIEKSKASDWMPMMVQHVEQRVWKVLEEKIEQRIQEVAKSVAKMLMKEMNSKGERFETSFSGIRTCSCTTRSRTSQEEDMDTDALRAFNQHLVSTPSGIGLTRNGFFKGIRSIYAYMVKEQTDMIFRHYCARNDVRLVAYEDFRDMVEAIGEGDTAAAELAGVNLNTFQALYHQAEHQAAIKIQSLQRGKLARREVNLRKNRRKVTSEADKLGSIKEKARRMLMQAHIEGTLRNVLHKQKVETAEQMKRVDELRLRIKNGLRQAVRDKNLNDDFAKAVRRCAWGE